MLDPLRIPVVDESELQRLIGRRDLPIVLDFWASWCSPCAQLERDLEEAKADHRGQVLFARIDIDASPEAAELYDVGRVPTLLALHLGQETDRLDGPISPEELRAFLTRTRTNH